MRKRWFLIAVSLFIFLNGQIWARGKGDENVDEAMAIEEALENYGNFLIEENFEAWGELHSENVVKMYPNAYPTTNRADMVAHSMKGSDFMKVIAFECDIQETEVWGNHAFSWGLYQVELKPVAGGSTVIVDGKFLTLYEKTPDNKWIITHDCFNSNLPES